jgi:methionyl aminopeptidase
VLGRDRIQYKSAEQVRMMRRAGLVVADALDAVRAVLRPRVTTAELDAVAEEVIRSAGGTPSFMGYHGYPATLCVSVNEEIVHGIPGPRVIHAGDVVSVDCGAIVEGWHGDAAFTTTVDTDGRELAPRPPLRSPSRRGQDRGDERRRAAERGRAAVEDT